VLTDGSKGTWDASADTEALVTTRALEQHAAARMLGSRGKVVMLGAVDGELQATLSWRERVAYWIRRLQPDIVLGHDPWKRYRLHPDHRHAGWLTVDAVVAARDPHFHTEHGVDAHRPSTLLLFEADEADHGEDVTGWADVKVAALLEHRSQLRSTMHIEPGDDGTQLAAFRKLVVDRLAENGARVGVEHAELFRAIADL
jgi:LmbE family N-acetylglucosaminyl deacetylase